MNFFLYINRKLILFVGTVIILFFILIIFSKKINLMKIDLQNVELKLSKADISEPRFAINNDSKKIFVTAKEGNFISKKPLIDSYFDLRNRLEGFRFDNIAAALQNWSSRVTKKWILH